MICTLYVIADACVYIVYVHVTSPLRTQKYISQSNTCAADDHVVQEYVNLAKVSVSHDLQLISNSAYIYMCIHVHLQCICMLCVYMYVYTYYFIWLFLVL